MNLLVSTVYSSSSYAKASRDFTQQNISSMHLGTLIGDSNAGTGSELVTSGVNVRTMHIMKHHFPSSVIWAV